MKLSLPKEHLKRESDQYKDNHLNNNILNKQIIYTLIYSSGNKIIMAKAISPSAYSTAGVTMRVRKSPPSDKQIPTSSSSLGPMYTPGLPPLPKSLSSLLNANSGSWRETLRIQTHKNMIQDNLSGTMMSQGETESKTSPTSSSGRAVKGHTRGRSRRVSVPQGNLDGALAVLRKEMVRKSQVNFCGF